MTACSSSSFGGGRDASLVDAGRKFPQAGQHGQFAEVGWACRLVAGEHGVKTAEQGFGLGDAAAFQRLAHKRGGGGRNGAADTVETDIMDDSVHHLQLQVELVAAQRIEAFGPVAELGQRTEIARPPAVVDDYFLIQIVQVGDHANISRTLRSPPNSASTSRRVL